MGAIGETAKTGPAALVPGLGFAAALAIAASLLEPLARQILPLPALVIALVIGIWMHPLALRPAFAPGLRFCVSKVLRFAVALLGLRVALSDIAALGMTTALIVIVAMIATVLTGIAVARLFGQSSEFGTLAGTATAVCGASAALATSSVLPDYRGKEADTVFVVIAVNLLSTIAMLLYPSLGAALGFSPEATGVLIGGSIHDVAQVVGAGYAISEQTGAAAVIVKLFRVLLLLPFVLAISAFYARGGSGARAKVPFPLFAVAFLGLCLINSIVPFVPALADIYAPIKSAATLAANWGLVLAIAALGLGTSITSIAQLGWRHILTVTSTTIVILAIVTTGLILA